MGINPILTRINIQNTVTIKSTMTVLSVYLSEKLIEVLSC